MAILLDLPNEVLGPILHTAVFLAPNEGYGGPFNYANAAALALICQRFHRLVTPLLYADIGIQLNGQDPGFGRQADIRRTKLLHRTFRTNQSLWKHCRKLGIDINTASPSSPTPFDRESPVQNLLYVAVDFLTWFVGITELQIRPRCCYHYEDRRACPCIFPPPSDMSILLTLVSQHLTQLKVLEVYDLNNLRLPIITAGLNGACLQTLDLTGVCKIGSDLDWDALRANAGTASLTKLKLRHFTQSSQALEALVMWPAKLKAFEFSRPMPDYYSDTYALTRYTLGTMQTVLSHQKDSLCHIRIEELLMQGLYNFDVTDFSSLRTLYLSHNLTGIEIGSVANLVAPNLEEFRWDMRVEDQERGVNLEEFALPEEEWLRAFARAAIQRNSTVRIQVEFWPEPWMASGNRKGFEYPWDRMDRVAREIQPYGVQLSYGTPSVTRQEFLDFVDAPIPGYLFNGRLW